MPISSIQPPASINVSGNWAMRLRCFCVRRSNPLCGISCLSRKTSGCNCVFYQFIRRGRTPAKPVPWKRCSFPGRRFIRRPGAAGVQTVVCLCPHSRQFGLSATRSPRRHAMAFLLQPLRLHAWPRKAGHLLNIPPCHRQFPSPGGMGSVESSGLNSGRLEPLPQSII